MKIDSRTMALCGLWLGAMAFNVMGHAADGIDLLQGHYSHPSKQRYYGEDFDGKEHLVILKLSPTTAYFMADVAYVEWIFGVADLQDDGSLLYQEDQPEEGETETMPDGTTKQTVWPKKHFWCKFGIHPTKDGVVFSDPIDEQSFKDTRNVKGACVRDRTGSSNGVYNGRSFSKKDRRAFSQKEIKTIEKSDEYQAALKRRKDFLKTQQSPETAAPVPIK